MCHICNEASIGAIQSLGQLFNIGVQIFLIISAFCFGRQGTIDNIKFWYFKRIKRIAFPYETFFIILAVIYIIKNVKMLWINWISCLFFVQGMHVGVLGAEHTWFMTTLMICYILTPLIEKFWKRIQYKKTQWGILVGLLIVPFIMAYLLPNYIYFIVMCLAFATRFIGRIMIDGTKLYNLVIVNYTHYVAAACIFMLFSIIFSKAKMLKIVQLVDGISFEIYLCHYMFIVGPVSVMYITGNWIINSIIAVCIPLLFAAILHKLSKGMRKILRVHST